MDELIKYCDRGLEFQRQPESMEELASMFTAVVYFDDNLPWAFADLYNKGVELFGEVFAQFLPDVGKTKKTRNNWVAVGTRIPFDQRKYKLKFSFYSEVAYLLRESRESLLARAEAEEWSVSRLRKEIKGEKPKKPKMIECPNCHVTFEVPK